MLCKNFVFTVVYICLKSLSLHKKSHQPTTKPHQKKLVWILVKLMTYFYYETENKSIFTLAIKVLA